MFPTAVYKKGWVQGTLPADGEQDHYQVVLTSFLAAFNALY